jgi:deoxyadenosine/deoxycytidine kinase
MYVFYKYFKFDINIKINEYINCNTMPVIVSVEGNIGSGKSTFIRQLQTYTNTHTQPQAYSITFIQEPVDEWEKIRDSSGESILEKFYKNQAEYGFSFQIMAYITRLRKLVDAIESNPDGIFICERSLETDKYVFAKMLYDDQKIKEIDWNIYNYWFQTFVDKVQTNKIIYIQTSPMNCYNRVKQRNRSGENNIPLVYLENCHNYHESWLDQSTTNITTINGNVDIQDQEIYKNVLQSTLQEIHDEYNKKYNTTSEQLVR